MFKFENKNKKYDRFFLQLNSFTFFYYCNQDRLYILFNPNKYFPIKLSRIGPYRKVFELKTYFVCLVDYRNFMKNNIHVQQ